MPREDGPSDDATAPGKANPTPGKAAIPAPANPTPQAAIPMAAATPPMRPRSPSTSPLAFDATMPPPQMGMGHDETVAPSSDERTNPTGMPFTSPSSQRRPPSSQRTGDGGNSDELPELPEVSTAHYKTGSEIARGGMGRIVAAEDRRLGRPVALKELIDPVADLGRFQREALITARLQHPGIVPVYEAGRWPSGEPFFAMKLVSGRPLDRVIADAKTLQERLALLGRIAAATDAMAYAHSQRVIHRDLKPGNILIGDFGETVVIDWGLAKDLDAGDSPESAVRAPHISVEKKAAVDSDSSTLTVAGSVMGTPAYMAPEQARGEAVDQRADVFALGAMLYHLLAGVPPYNARTATDVIAAAALGKVVPLVERVRGAPHDLVAIVERAMAPDVTDRYQNAGELADELHRFLNGKLVGAHEYSAFEKIVRFVKRHRAAVAISLVASIGFAVGGTLAIRRILREEESAKVSQQIAVARQNAAEGLVAYMQADIRNLLESVGRLDLLEKLGASVHEYYDALAKVEGGMGPTDAERMATAIDMLGDAEMRSGKTDRAFATWSDARSQLVIVVHGDKSARTFSQRRLIARLDDQLGRVHQQRGKLDKALAAYKKAKDELDELRVENGSDRALLLAAADAEDHIGDVLRAQGKLDEAFESYAAAKIDREKAASQGNGKTTDELVALSTSHMKQGSVYQARGESSLALNEYRSALRQRETLYEGEPDNVEFQMRLLEAQTARAELERIVGDEKKAIETYKDAIQLMDGLYRRDPTNAVWKRQRGMMYADYGFVLFETGAFNDGNKQLDIALEIEKELADRDQTNSQYAVELSRTYTRAGDAAIHLGDVDKGIEKFELALEIRLRLSKKDPGSVPFRRSLAFSYHKLAGAHVMKATRTDLAKALELYEQALEMRDKLAGEAASAGGFKDELASTEILLGRQLASLDPKRAADLITSGLKRSKELVDGDAINNMWKETSTQGLLAKAELARAAGNTKARENALVDARAMTETAMKRTENVRWIGYLAEIHAGLADVAAANKDPKAAKAEWTMVRDLLEPLAKEGRLSWTRKPLVEKARLYAPAK